MIIGYARVSTKEQNLDRQIKDLEDYGCEKIFLEKQSGKNFNRPIYQDMRSMLRFGDVLVVHDLSRFGRNKDEIRNEWKAIIDEEIDIVVLNMPILDTRKYKELPGVGQLVSDLVLTLLSWMVEEERQRITQAQREGIAIAKTKGKFKGRPMKYHENAKDPKDRLIYNEIIRMLDNNKSVQDISNETGVTRMTIYNVRNRR
ncbi:MULTISPECIES: recombinase family protein [Psychrobacillus]|uniref:recombinase family protein n=1 Tax=Psychrobacillus TaxID=1221880 RepID=UPI0030FBF5A8